MRLKDVRKCRFCKYEAPLIMTLKQAQVDVFEHVKKMHPEKRPFEL